MKTPEWFDGPQYQFGGEQYPHAGTVSIRGVQIQDADGVSVERWVTLNATHVPGGDVSDVLFDGIDPEQARHIGNLLVQAGDEALRSNAADRQRGIRIEGGE